MTAVREAKKMLKPQHLNLELTVNEFHFKCVEVFCSEPSGKTGRDWEIQAEKGKLVPLQPKQFDGVEWEDWAKAAQAVQGAAGLDGRQYHEIKWLFRNVPKLCLILDFL